ncbi:RdgB/HAM1 family non-canonical purine NTP pyrophosphatase [uncultured Aquimonas sp.]|uniref:RdgB/HAM1 family non-canonical purine NTP pyrophosphatase n=1 Tax=uncultured Aquimonas sp. TaxID=385483 RepID=UPI00086DC7CC|nr:RdgB/HAM1 family non-canonical purine NTP pyrophosphatase [uncultured Aquimonas sp.]ODU44557.1 MAG: non-canonical purine NTP pyrophosphatase, RdgB/HAM1 family [Xanthomonadaceae bacterium SCN 69-123]
MQKLVLASGNAGKLREFREILAPHGFELIAQGELGIPDPDETGLSFVENALLKARHASEASGLPALADDSGLCVDALGSAPGLYSARYAGAHGDHAANIRKLLGELASRDDSERGAFFISVIALIRHPLDPAPLIAQGRWQGRILHAPRGSGGFGYDPVFLDPDSGLSAAELEPAQKHRISHRGRAVAELLKALQHRD